MTDDEFLDLLDSTLQEIGVHFLRREIVATVRTAIDERNTFAAERKSERAAEIRETWQRLPTIHNRSLATQQSDS
jgi:hypothetical protein